MALHADGLARLEDALADYWWAQTTSGQFRAGACTSIGTYLGPAQAGTLIQINSPVGTDVEFDCTGGVEVLVKSGATYQFRKIEIRTHNADFLNGDLMLTLERDTDVEYTHGGKVVLESLSISIT